MIGCIDIQYIGTGILKLVNSQLFSTILGIVLGSYVITKFHAKRARDCDSIKDIIKNVDQYAKLAFDYWKYTGKRSLERKIISARLKTDGFFIYEAARSVPKVGDDHDLLMDISELWEVATGGCFESDDEGVKASMGDNVIGVARAARKLKAKLFNHINAY